MIRITIVLLTLIMCIACDPVEPTDEQDNHISTVVDTSSTSEASKNKVIRARFESAVVYAGSTEFYFKLEGSEEYYSFKVSNIAGMTSEELEAEMPYLEGLNIDVGVPLVDPREDLEGPPGGNPMYLEHLFELVFDEEETLLSVQPIDEKLE